MEIPAAFREIAEKSVSQAKETYERMRSAAEEATDVLEDTYATATKGVSDFGLKLIEGSREYEFGLRLRDPAHDDQIPVGGGGSFDGTYAQTVRGDHCPVEGIDRDRPEGCGRRG